MRYLLNKDTKEVLCFEDKADLQPFLSRPEKYVEVDLSPKTKWQQGEIDYGQFWF